MRGFIKTPGRCSCPMWRAGLPAGMCDEEAYGVFIEGQTWRDAYTGEEKRFDRKYNGYVPGLACPRHGGPEKAGPRVFEDGTDGQGRPMWCAVYEDFENLQESPAEFHVLPWIAIKLLTENHPRNPPHD